MLSVDCWCLYCTFCVCQPRAASEDDADAVLRAQLAAIQEPVLGFWGAFLNSVAMIIVTELGDKTFFIAAILAMQYDR